MARKGIAGVLLAGVLTVGLFQAVAAAANVPLNYGQCHRTGTLAGGWRQNGVGPVTTNAKNLAHGPTMGNDNGKPPFTVEQACVAP
jgi:hypothetical protein